MDRSSFAGLKSHDDREVPSDRGAVPRGRDRAAASWEGQRHWSSGHSRIGDVRVLAGALAPECGGRGGATSIPEWFGDIHSTPLPREAATASRPAPQTVTPGQRTVREAAITLKGGPEQDGPQDGAHLLADSGSPRGGRQPPVLSQRWRHCVGAEGRVTLSWIRQKDAREQRPRSVGLAVPVTVRSSWPPGLGARRSGGL